MYHPPSRLLTVLCLGVFLAIFPACDSTEDDPMGPGDDGLLDEAASNPGEWFFVQPEGMQCRDGSATGFGIRYQEGAENLVIYLEGGGACFNEATCATNPSSFSAADFTTLAAQRGNLGIFDPGSANPVGDWNAIYVPYCTGDVHGGSNPGTLVPNVGVQQFVGHMNVERVLDVVDLALADDPAKVLLTGASAGGFGTLVNFAQVTDRFDASQSYLVDDSGPIFFADDVLSPALAAGFNTLYDLQASLPDDATDAGLFESDGLQGIYDYYDERYPNATFGLSSYLQDRTIQGFFAFGQPDQDITDEEFAAGLEDIRTRLSDSWGTYYAEGTDHTFLGSPDRYFGSVNGTVYADWLADIVSGEATDVAPEPTRIAGK